MVSANEDGLFGGYTIKKLVGPNEGVSGLEKLVVYTSGIRHHGQAFTRGSFTADGTPATVRQLQGKMKIIEMLPEKFAKRQDYLHGLRLEWTIVLNTEADFVKHNIMSHLQHCEQDSVRSVSTIFFLSIFLPDFFEHFWIYRLETI